MKKGKIKNDGELVEGSLIKTVLNGEVIIAAVTEVNPLKAVQVVGKEFTVDPKNYHEFVL